MKLKALLVYPKYPETFWNFKQALKFISRKAMLPPLGLLTISPMLPCEWEKKLVDMNVRKLSDDDIMWADVVLISAMLAQLESTREVVKRCKAYGKTIIVGGPGFTTQVENFCDVDHFVLNEAEVTLPLFLEDFERGNAKRIYSSDEKPNITTTPIPDWSLINFKNYSSMPIQYSRGCPFDCEFCDIIVMNGRIPRTKTAEQIIAEFQSLYDAGWRRDVFVVDDNFIGNKVSVKKLLSMMIEWQEKHRYPFRIVTEASVNLSDDEELMSLMSKANFYKVFLGIETPCVESLAECGKSQNINKNLHDAINKIHAHGLQVMGGFIVGFDNDKESIFDSQISFIQRAGVVTAMVGILVALPQTRLWFRLKEEGRLKGIASGHHDGETNFTTKMSPTIVKDGFKRVISTIYSPKEYYRRISTFLKNYKPTMKSKLTFSDIRAFVRSTVRIGFFSKARFKYWKLITKTFFTKTKSFPAVIELAILGQHFEKMSKKLAKAM